MDFSLTSEQQEIQDMARNFTRSEIAPVQLKMDADYEFPYELWRKWSDLGMAGMLISTQTIIKWFYKKMRYLLDFLSKIFLSALWQLLIM